MKKIKILSIGLMSVMLLSTSVFASDISNSEKVVDNDNDTRVEATMLRTATNFQDKGGWGEYGWGLRHAWAKYTHPQQTHRVVLVVDSSYHYGAYELAGPQNYSYTEALKGDRVSAYGELN